jgi:hypothetical protein
MSVEIGTEATRFPEKKYINGIFIAVYRKCSKFRNNETVTTYFSDIINNFLTKLMCSLTVLLSS